MPEPANDRRSARRIYEDAWDHEVRSSRWWIAALIFSCAGMLLLAR